MWPIMPSDRGGNAEERGVVTPTAPPSPISLPIPSSLSLPLLPLPAGQDNYNQLDHPQQGRFMQVGCGDSACCALEAGTGSIHCWGNPLTTISNPPAGSYVQLSVGNERMACAISENEGGVRCWGMTLANSNPKRSHLKPSFHFQPDAIYTQVSATLNGGCAVKIDGSVDCFDMVGQPAFPPFFPLNNTASTLELTSG